MTLSDRVDPWVVAVDGPAGSGKSTLGRRLGLALRLPLIDTGLFYRAITVAVLRAGIDPGDPQAAAALAARTRIELNTDPAATCGDWRVRLDGLDATAEAYEPGLVRTLSQLSGLAGVRLVLLEPMRQLAASGGVAVGRDCGTVVFPEARVKLWLEAAGEVRASRRAAQLRRRGRPVDADELSAEVADRDAADSGRAVAPARPAADAVVIDTGMMDIEAMVARALAVCAQAGISPPAAAVTDPQRPRQ